MTGWNKSFAGFGAFCALILFFQLVPKQTIVVGPKRSLAVVPANGVAETEQKPRRGITPRGPMDEDPVAETPAEKPVAAVEEVATPVAVEVAAPVVVETAVEAEAAPAAETIDFGARGLTGSANLAPPDPVPAPVRFDAWEPVVTRTDAPAPSAGTVDAKSAAKPAETVLARSPAKPKSNWQEAGIADAHASIAPILAAHPDRDLVLCLAGCGDGMSIVQIRKRPQIMAAVSELIPTAGAPGHTPTGDVICIAGCVGAPGKVVFTNVRLSWISDDGSNEIKAALRAIASRIIESEGLTIDDFARSWVSIAARDQLLRDGPGPEQFAYAGPAVAAWMRRLPGTTLVD